MMKRDGGHKPWRLFQALASRATLYNGSGEIAGHRPAFHLRDRQTPSYESNHEKATHSVFSFADDAFG
jgi:hypothetical protein